MANQTYDEPPLNDGNPLQVMLNDDFIRRLPVKQSATIGSIYDARIDCIVGNISLPNNVVSKSKRCKYVYCKVFEINLMKVENIINSLGIDDDLWLSTTLNMVSSDGVAALVDDPFNTDIKARILHYCCVSEEKRVQDQVYEIRDTIKEETANIEATHIVAAIRSGIHVVVVLKLPMDRENEMNDLLEKIRECLINNTFKIMDADKDLFNQLIVTKVFSNIPDMKKIKKLTDLCQQIIGKKTIVAVHRPLQCFLRPIQWFYPLHVKNKAIYVALSRNTIQIVKQYLLPLWFKLKSLQTFIHSEIEELSREHLPKQLHVIQEGIETIQLAYSVKIESIHELILRIRSGNLKQDLIADSLVDTNEPSLETSIDICLEQIRSFKEKVKFINDLNHRKMTYFNIQNLSIKQHDDLKTILRATLQTDKEGLVLCCTDGMKDENFADWNHHYNNWMTRHESNNLLNLIYADFSYVTSFHLSNIQILSINSSNTAEQQSNFSTSSISSVIETISSTNAKLDSPESVSVFNTETNPIREDKPVYIQRARNVSDSSIVSTSGIAFEQNVESEENQAKSDILIPLETLKPVVKPRLARKSLAKMDNSANAHQLVTPSTENIMELSTEQQCSTSNTSKIGTHSLTSSLSIIVTLPAGQNDSETTSTTSCMSLTETQSPPKDSDVKMSESNTTPIPTPRQRRREMKIQLECEKTEQHLPIEQNASLSQSKNEQNLDQELIHNEYSKNKSILEKTQTNSPRPDSSHLPSSKHINVLLLGESGVGKSTFINALVNYIKFESFKNAHSNEPVVAMPVSFLLTTGDQFQENIVKFGDEDTNEDHHHPGQSVTQHCRSYTFQSRTQQKIRIIDTPGIGDTRGQNQDDLNIQHILAFISNLSHLNAICILLKPNESRLNIVFRSYFDRLLNFLGENARHNIVFCFTNTRATFYAPGNTAPLLKKMLSSSAIKNVPFEKSNTFCFDSESFRYLVALRYGIKFNTFEENEYEQSWTKSAVESARLLTYVCGTQLKPYVQHEWQSIGHAQFKINQMIRPILETMRNLFRNILVLQINPASKLIKLCPFALQHSSVICYTCGRTPEYYNEFLVFSDLYNRCDCDQKPSAEVDYGLQYEVSDKMGEESLSAMELTVLTLKTAIMEFAQFYAKYCNKMNNTDPIMVTLKRMLAEEKQFSAQANFGSLNEDLYGLLIRLRRDYKEAQKTSMLTDASIDLLNVYERLKMISEIDEIKAQMALIRKRQKNFIKNHEKNI
ncbi:unnamed protein product [Rotaria socialis]|uniref:G domain-containing protein n=2 Tax=Rotaria socialis TaxID=392032 RepID=A0A818MJX6_9BILA|nr:unnamed protein product [Rotaria socialis]CAF4679248.1 unnamed protein product [Rotaria socialis]